jgi:hypothetical protein
MYREAKVLIRMYDKGFFLFLFLMKKAGFILRIVQSKKENLGKEESNGETK